LRGRDGDRPHENDKWAGISSPDDDLMNGQILGEEWVCPDYRLPVE
jgi:hypothetical protein